MCLWSRHYIFNILQHHTFAVYMCDFEVDIYYIVDITHLCIHVFEVTSIIQHITRSHICCIHMWLWSRHLLYSTYYNITHLLYTCVHLKTSIWHITTSHICCIHCDFKVDIYYIQHITTSHICCIHVWFCRHLLYSTYWSHICCIHVWLWSRHLYIQHITTSHICCIHVWLWSRHLLYSTYYNITHLLYTCVTLK